MFRVLSGHTEILVRGGRGGTEQVKYGFSVSRLLYTPLSVHLISSSANKFYQIFARKLNFLHRYRDAIFRGNEPLERTRAKGLLP